MFARRMRLALLSATLVVLLSPVAAGADSGEQTVVHLAPALSAPGVHATATLTVQAGASLLLSIEADGLNPNSMYTAHIHAGTMREPSASFGLLGTLQTDAAGHATLQTSTMRASAAGTDVDLASSDIADGQHLIEVHGPNSDLVTSGQIPRANSASSDWEPGPNAVGEYFCNGVIDSPGAGVSVPGGGMIQVSGWIVDMNATGWAGFDDVHVYDGLAGSGRFLTKGIVGMSRPDVGLALGNPYAFNSGFAATIPAGLLDAGQHTLTVYAHAPDKGWWYQQVNVNVVAQAPVQNPRLVAAIANPAYGGNIYTDDDTYTITGYALDQSANINQGSQGTGIDRVQVYMNDAYFGDADLAFSDSRAATFGNQFANGGFRFTFKPTKLHEGNVQLEVRAHSVVTDKEVSVPTTFTLMEGANPKD